MSFVHYTWPFVLTTCLLSAALGCGRDDDLGPLNVKSETSATTDTTSATGTTAPMDAGGDVDQDVDQDADDDATNDAEEDTVEDTGPEVRRLVTRRLMGTTPVNNRVLDPRFQAEGGTFWLYFDFGEFQLIPMTRSVHSDNPTQLPSLEDAFRNPGAERILLISAKVPPEPSRISIWVGERGLDAGPARPPTSLNVIGMNLEGEETSFRLRWTGESSEGVGGTWWKADAVVDELATGFVYVTVEGLNRGAYAVTAPVVVADTAEGKRKATVPVVSRPMNTRERTALQLMEDIRQGREVPKRMQKLTLPENAPSVLRDAFKEYPNPLRRR